MTAETTPATPAHASASRSRGRSLGLLLGWTALAALLVPVAARVTGWEAGPLALLVALMPWMTLACLLPLAVAAVVRSPVLAIASAAALALGVAWQVPVFTAADAAGERALTIASVNLTYGGADADAVLALVREHHVDVLVAQEVTPEAVEALEAAGLATALPHAQVAAEPGVTGTALWSRTPLADAETLPGFTTASSNDRYLSRAVRADVEIAGASVSVLAVHPAAPGPIDHSGWQSSMEVLADHLAAHRGPILVAGDFNTTRDHRVFRDLESLGYADAADQSGSGLQFTFPEGRRPWPLVTIDHVLERDTGLVATAVSTVAVAGADHRALVVDYAPR